MIDPVFRGFRFVGGEGIKIWAPSIQPHSTPNPKPQTPDATPNAHFTLLLNPNPEAPSPTHQSMSPRNQTSVWRDLPLRTPLPLIPVLRHNLSKLVMQPRHALVATSHAAPTLLLWHNAQVAQRQTAFPRPEPSTGGRGLGFRNRGVELRGLGLGVLGFGARGVKFWGLGCEGVGLGVWSFGAWCIGVLGLGLFRFGAWGVEIWGLGYGVLGPDLYSSSRRRWPTNCIVQLELERK